MTNTSDNGGETNAPRALTLADHVREAAGAMEEAGLHFGHGTATAWDEACWMAAHACRLPPDFPPSVFEDIMSQGDRQRFDRLLRDRIGTRKPLAYLIGEAWFAGLAFQVSPEVLVPRSPIAELILNGFSPWLDMDRVRAVADVGTGCGCLAIATAFHWPRATVDAFDVSPGALELARLNAERHGVGERVRPILSDLLEGAGSERYDLIISNPPYVPLASMAALPAEYLEEPSLGLVAGTDGLDLVRRLLRQLPGYLNPGGVAVVEVGEAQPALEALLPDAPLVWLEFEYGGEGVFLLDEAGCHQVAETLR